MKLKDHKYPKSNSRPNSLRRVSTCLFLVLLSMITMRTGAYTNLQDALANKITSIPECITTITALKEIRLKKNGMNTLPETIGDLTSLLVLDVSGNQFSEVPASLGQLAALRKLYTELIK